MSIYPIISIVNEFLLIIYSLGKISAKGKTGRIQLLYTNAYGL